MASSCRLVAVGKLAESFQGPDGPNLPLKDPTTLGRSVHRGQGYRFPVNWVQISGQHCTLFVGKADGLWYVKDTSTNGTFLNNVRIEKHKAVRINEGDRLTLSCASGDIEVLEYVFSASGNAQGHEGDHASNKSEHKDMLSPCNAAGGEDGRRKRLRSENGPISPLKSIDDANSNKFIIKQVTQLQESNQELRRKLDGSRVALEEAEKKLQEKEAALQESHQQKNEEIKKAQEMERAVVQEYCKGLEADLEAARKLQSETEQKLKLEEASSLEKDRGIAEIQVCLKSTETLCDDLKKDLELAVSEKEAAKKLLEEARNRANEYHTQAGQTASENEKLKEELRMLNGKLDEEKSAKKNAKEDYEKEVKSVVDSRVSIEELEAKLNKLDGIKSQLEKELKDLKGLHEIALERVKEENDRQAFIQAQAANFALQCSEFVNSIVGSRKSAESLDTDLSHTHIVGKIERPDQSQNADTPRDTVIIGMRGTLQLQGVNTTLELGDDGNKESDEAGSPDQTPDQVNGECPKHSEGLLDHNSIKTPGKIGAATQQCIQQHEPGTEMDIDTPDTCGVMPPTQVSPVGKPDGVHEKDAFKQGEDAVGAMGTNKVEGFQVTQVVAPQYPLCDPSTDPARRSTVKSHPPSSTSNSKSAEKEPDTQEPPLAVPENDDPTQMVTTPQSQFNGQQQSGTGKTETSPDSDEQSGENKEIVEKVGYFSSPFVGNKEVCGTGVQSGSGGVDKGFDGLGGQQSLGFYGLVNEIAKGDDMDGSD